jgi:predicted RNA-binding protein YlxR (DUF448 family)/ribosomal protein L30E
MLAIAEPMETRDTGPKAPGTERFCVVARAVRPTDEMLRFVAGPDGTVVPDIKRKLPGRGVWVTGNREAVTEAVRRGILPRGLKANVRAPAELPELVDRLLERAALDALAMAHKAGRIVAGFERVESAIAAGGLAAVIHAADAAPDGVRKLGWRAEGQFPVISTFTSSQLDLALGRPHVIHAALLGGREGETFLARWRTLERYRMNAGRGAPKRAGYEAVQPDAARKLGTE